MIAVRASVGYDGGRRVSGNGASGSSNGDGSGRLCKQLKRSSSAYGRGRFDEGPYLRRRTLILMLGCALALLSMGALSRGFPPISVAEYERQPCQNPSIAIFAGPGPFSLLDSAASPARLDGREELAVRSWLALSPDVSVVLFGRHPTVLALAEALGPRVTVESDIDSSFLGTPFFHSMISRMMLASNADISVLADIGTILLPDFVAGLHKAHQMNTDWLLVSMTPTVPRFPFHLDDDGMSWVDENGEHISFAKLHQFLVQNHHPNNCSGEKTVLAWNTNSAPLHAVVIPPFLYGKGLHNRWLINEILESNSRLVIDASNPMSSFYLEGLHPSTDYNFTDIEKEELKRWERSCNVHLASLYGTLYFKEGFDLTKVLRLVQCGGKHFTISPSENTGYLLRALGPEGSLEALQKPSAMKYGFWFLKSKSASCVEKDHLLHMRTNCTLKNVPLFKLEPPASLSLPLPLESLLEAVADKNKTIVLTVAADSYRDMLMSWVCRLRKLLVTNFLVCALDAETYQFSMLQGLPVFKDPMAPGSISYDNCHFGTECFKRVTKVKSRLVLQILKLGYSVLLSDVDVYWFKNPIPFLRSFGPGVLVGQSDEYNKTGPINLPRRLNSGFYFARSDAPTISAIEKVVKHASLSGLSEQPSFYDVLCGEGGVKRVGSDRCYEPETGLTVQFLNRDLFPNGAYQGLWQKRKVQSACRKKGCLILHNNWISGRQRKLERQVKSGLWAYDPSSRTCLPATAG